MSMENEKTPNVQIYPARTRVVPNFKLAKVMCNLSGEKYERAIEGEKRGIIEKKNHKKYGNVVTSYKIANADNYDGTDPLTELDRAILSVYSSEWEEGNRHTTPAIIFRSLTGKVGRGDAEPSKNQLEAIMNSVMKLIGTLIWIDDTKTNEQLKYEPTSVSKKFSSIMPAYFVEKTVNGKDAIVIYFDRESPIMEIARKRNQLIRFDTALLDVPNQNNTPMNITIKNYVIIRVMEIKLHNLTPTLTFGDIFEKCRITDASSQTQKNARETIEVFFAHLQANGVIKSFELVKKGIKFHSVRFTY